MGKDLTKDTKCKTELSLVEVSTILNCIDESSLESWVKKQLKKNFLSTLGVKCK